MPSHPDRVRRHYRPDPPRFPLNREILEGEPVCAVCGSGQGTHVLSERGHAFVTRVRGGRGVAITDEGFTANVIEGERH